MKKSTLHLIGAVLLLTAVFVAWPKSEVPPSSARPEPSNRKTIKDTAPKPIPTPRPKPGPILKTPLITVHSQLGHSIRVSSAEELQAALAQVLELPSSQTRDEVIASLIARMDLEQAKEAWLKWKHARTEPWLKAAGEICLKLAADDPFGPADFINENIPEAARFGIWRNLFHAMDFQSTSEVLNTLPLHRDTINHASHVARNWIQSDPKACLAWLDQYLPQLSREEATDFLRTSYTFTGHLKPDLQKRIAAFNQATNPNTRDYLARLVLSTKTPDKEARIKFLDGLAETMPDLYRERTAAANSPVQKIYADPQGFARSLDAQKFKSLELKDWQLLISQLRDRNPAMAAETLVKFGDIRGSQLSGALLSWHQLEPATAMEFAKNLPKTEVHQKAIYRFAEITAHFKNKEATEQLISLLTSIKDQNKVRAKLNAKKE
jgi:hypothetical protein